VVILLLLLAKASLVAEAAVEAEGAPKNQKKPLKLIVELVIIM
jgi:hypothetical protein